MLLQLNFLSCSNKFIGIIYDTRKLDDDELHTRISNKVLFLY